MPTNYVLVDFENVQPDSLAALATGQFRVKVFVGASQAKGRISFELVHSMQALGANAEYVKIARTGKNCRWDSSTRPTSSNAEGRPYTTSGANFLNAAAVASAGCRTLIRAHRVPQPSVGVWFSGATVSSSATRSPGRSPQA